jgi:hypothetical protein
MHDSIGIIGIYLVVIGFLLLTLQVMKQLMPGTYRLAQQFLKRLSYLVTTQAKRRGWAFAILVHTAALLAVFLLIVGLMTASFETIVAGIICGIVAIAAKRAIDALRRLRARHRVLPGWRR